MERGARNVAPPSDAYRNLRATTCPTGEGAYDYVQFDMEEETARGYRDSSAGQFRRDSSCGGDGDRRVGAGEGGDVAVLPKV